MPQGEVGESEIPLEGCRLEFSLGSAKEREPRGSSSDCRLEVSCIAVAVGEIEQIYAPPAIIESVTQAPDLFKVGERNGVFAVERCVARESHENPHLEVGLHAQSGPQFGQDPVQERSSLDRVSLLILPTREPVVGEGLLGFSPQARKKMRGRGSCTNGIPCPVKTGKSFGQPQQQLSPASNAGGLFEQGLIGVDRPLPSASGELKVRLESCPSFELVLEESTNRQAEPLGEEAERGHRRLAQAVLEGADVGLGIAARRELLLGQSGSEPSAPNPRSDAACELALVDARSRSLDGAHGSEYTTQWLSR